MNSYTEQEVIELFDAKERGETYEQISQRTGRTVNSLRHKMYAVRRNRDLPGSTPSSAPAIGPRDVGDPGPSSSEYEKQLAQKEKQLQLAERTIGDLSRALNRHAKVIKTPANTFRFALISDTHYGSLYHDAGALESFLRYVAASGVKTVLHAGDVLEGEKMHFGQDRELSHAGLTQQLESLSTFPKLDLDVKFITGNHDICYVKSAGVNVGQMIADATGWECLGDMYGEAHFETPNTTYRVGLLHPRDGSAYALSYKLQKTIEQWTGGKKPNMLVAGHYHKAVSLPQYRNVHGIHPGCFQQQTSFMAGKGLAAHVGGYIMEVSTGGEEELWNTVRAEFVSYY